VLIGYISDERHVALDSVSVELIDGNGRSIQTASRASGAIHADVPAGDYNVILQKPGFGSKRTRVRVPSNIATQFRLLSDGLLGYAWPKWQKFGGSSEFRVHAVEPYKIELWRYGWEPEFIKGLGWHDEHGPRPCMQTLPDGDISQIGAQWNKVGYRSNVHSQSVPAPEKSGLYYFRAWTNSGRQFSFPWIVSPDKPRCNLAVLASNITWNAYNNFGGRSNYINEDRLPSTPCVNARTDLHRYSDRGEFNAWNSDRYEPLSFDRPELFNDIAFDERITDPIEGRQACGLAPAEWRLLGWLEKSGFQYDFWAETQLDTGELDLSGYRVLVSAVHPEYWTRRMFDRVKNWVFKEKGRFVYLGGNGLNCEVQIDYDEMRMTVHNGRITGLSPDALGADSRMAMRHESEASLLGVAFTPTGAMTGAPYRVVDPEHWVFAGTNLKAGQLFGENCLHQRCPGGASGHETDKRTAASPPGCHLLAKGLNPDDGGAEMVIFDTPSGGSVFSVGSINYVSSLPVDESISTVTANVLNRFLESQ
jgi:hypothetical protein